MPLTLDTSRFEITTKPLSNPYGLECGTRYRLKVETNGDRTGIYLGRNVAFGCTCCGESSGLIWGHFFLSGNPAKNQKTKMTIIPEQDIRVDEESQVRSDGGVLIREFTLNEINLDEVLSGNPNGGFYGYLSLGSIQDMLRDSKLAILAN